MITHKRILVFCLLLMSSLATAQGWRLVWSDEFNTPGLPDSTKWGYDVGGGGWGNSELEYYTDHRSANASVANGVLTITAIKESYSGNSYTSARLLTTGKGDWLYGRFDIRAKIPRGVGMWPAIWFLPTDWVYGGWPASGELDLMENVGFDSTNIYSTTHSAATGGSGQGGHVSLVDPWDTWHDYRMEWYTDHITFWVDSTLVFTFNNANNSSSTWPFDKRFHLLLNIAIGGGWGGQHGVDDSRFPQSMLVDYVRVYQSDTLPAASVQAPPTGEMAWNGDFAQDAAKWSLGAYQNAAATGMVDSGEYHAKITAAGTADWNVQLNQAEFVFEQGQTYTISFRARSSIARTIAVAGNQNTSPYTTYGKDTMQISTTMQNYSFNFTMTQATDNNARIEFDLGGVASDLWLDDISVKKVSIPTSIHKAAQAKSTSLASWAHRHTFDLLGRSFGGSQ